jgi:glycerol uptake facilitator-like aquaporin
MFLVSERKYSLVYTCCGILIYILPILVILTHCDFEINSYLLTSVIILSTFFNIAWDTSLVVTYQYQVTILLGYYLYGSISSHNINAAFTIFAIRSCIEIYRSSLSLSLLSLLCIIIIELSLILFRVGLTFILILVILITMFLRMGKLRLSSVEIGTILSGLITSCIHYTSIISTAPKHAFITTLSDSALYSSYSSMQYVSIMSQIGISFTLCFGKLLEV